MTAGNLAWSSCNFPALKFPLTLSSGFHGLNLDGLVLAEAISLVPKITF